MTEGIPWASPQLGNGLFRRKAGRTEATVAAYLSTWLKAKRSLRPSTIQSYETHVRLYLVPHLGTVPLSELRPTHVDAMYQRIGAPDDEGRALSEAALRRIQ